MEAMKDVASLLGEQNTQNAACLTNIVKHGLSLGTLHNFVKSKPENILQNICEVTRKLLSAENESAKMDLFLEIYDRIYEEIPATTVAETIFLVELICILALLRYRMPSPPSQLLRALFLPIPDELWQDIFISEICQNVFSVSSDIGDKTYLCKLFASLGPKGHTLTPLLCWITLKHILNAEQMLTPKPSIPELHKMISTYGSPKTIKGLAMTIRLIGILINILALREKGKNVELSSNWLMNWLSSLSMKFKSMFLDFEPQILDVIALEGLITDITKSWPHITTGSEFK